MKRLLLPLLVLLFFCTVYASKKTDRHNEAQTTLGLLQDRIWKRTGSNPKFYRFSENKLEIFNDSTLTDIYSSMDFYLSDRREVEFDKRNVGKSFNGEYIICNVPENSPSITYRIENIHPGTLLLRAIHLSGEQKQIRFIAEGENKAATETMMDLLTASIWTKKDSDKRRFMKFNDSLVYESANIDNLEEAVGRGNGKKYYLSYLHELEFDEKKVGVNKNGNHIIIQSQNSCPKKSSHSTLVINILTADTLSYFFDEFSGGGNLIWTQSKNH